MHRLLLLGLVLTGAAWADADLLTASSKRWHDAVKPLPSEQRWKQISWMLDLGEAIKDAKAEKRPLVIWVSGDDPLDRC